jgi:hypothetical protein
MGYRGKCSIFIYWHPHSHVRAKTRNNYAQWFVFFDNVGINVEMLEELRRTFSAGHWFRGGLYLGLNVGHGLQTGD